MPMWHFGSVAMNLISFRRLTRSWTTMFPFSSTPCRWEGSGATLPPPRPLRTGRESHPSSGSSHSSAPRRGTEQRFGIYRSSASGEVRRPCRVERICHATYLDVSLDRDGHGTEQPQALGSAVTRYHCGKYPAPVSLYVKVFLSNPTGTFHGVSTHCPLPEEVPNSRVDR